MSSSIKLDQPSYNSPLHHRARAEYLEMPGLSLTLPQAARLFALDRTVCASVLDRLVIEGFLHQLGEHYARINTGRRSL